MPPTYATSTFAFPDVAYGARCFAGTEPGYFYTRVANPTLALLEARLDEVSVKLRGRRFESPASGAAGFRPRRRGTPGSGGILSSTSGFAGTPGASNHSPGD